jgi:uncharacterized membrane protein YgaE (UPF0421/DUF939 family)
MKRLVVFILIFAILLTFAILNLDSKSNISFGFTELYDVPVFISSFFAFMLGLLVALIMLSPIFRRRPKPESPGAGKEPKAKTKAKAKVPDEIKKEPSSYGID